MKTFQNKVVVITGAGSGMGRSYAQALAAQGAQLALNDYKADGLAETEALVRKTHPQTRILSQCFDVGDAQAVQAFADAVASQMGGADLVINNAGVGGSGLPVWACSQAEYEATMRINFFGVLYGTKAFLPQLLKKGEGAVVNVSSIFGLVGTPNSSDYCAAKFAVRGFTESLMVELRDTPIGVYLVHPGGINTNIAKDIENGEAFTQKYLKTSPDAIVQHVLAKIKAGKPRIVFGHQAFRVWLASWLLPLKTRNKLIHQDMRDALGSPHYDLIQPLRSR